MGDITNMNKPSKFVDTHKLELRIKFIFTSGQVNNVFFEKYFLLLLILLLLFFINVIIVITNIVNVIIILLLSVLL